MIPVAELGTDPAMARDAWQRNGKTGKLKGTREMILVGPRFGDAAPATKLGPAVAIGVALRNPFAAKKSVLESYLKVRNAMSFDPISYKPPQENLWVNFGSGKAPSV